MGLQVPIPKMKRGWATLRRGFNMMADRQRLAGQSAWQGRGVGFSDMAGGAQLDVPEMAIPNVRRFQITGVIEDSNNLPAYSFQEVMAPTPGVWIPDTGGLNSQATFSAPQPGLPFGPLTAIPPLPAYELTNNPNVPLDGTAIVEAWPDPSWGFFLFRWSTALTLSGALILANGFGGSLGFPSGNTQSPPAAIAMALQQSVYDTGNPAYFSSPVGIPVSSGTVVVPKTGYYILSAEVTFSLQAPAGIVVNPYLVLNPLVAQMLVAFALAGNIGVPAYGQMTYGATTTPPPNTPLEILDLFNGLATVCHSTTLFIASGSAVALLAGMNPLVITNTNGGNGPPNPIVATAAGYLSVRYLGPT